MKAARDVGSVLCYGFERVMKSLCPGGKVQEGALSCEPLQFPCGILSTTKFERDRREGEKSSQSQRGSKGCFIFNGGVNASRSLRGV